MSFSFPYEFSKPVRGDYDFFSPLVNLTGNAGIVAVGGMSTAAITYYALNALGFSNFTKSIVTPIPVVIGITGIIGTIFGGCMLVAIAIAAAKRLGR